jgi:hypothetical protein
MTEWSWQLNEETIEAINTIRRNIIGHAVPLFELIDRMVNDEDDVVSIQGNDEREEYAIVTTTQIIKTSY